MRQGPGPTIFDSKGLSARLMNLLAKALLTPRSPRFEIGFAAVAIVLSTLLRHYLDPVLPTGYPFLTFFPAVMLTAVFASIRAGVVVAVVSGLIAWFWFIGEPGSVGVSDGQVLAMGFFALITGTDILFLCAAIWALRALTDARAKAETLADSRSLMFSELQHRISNNLQTVSTLLRMQAAQVQDDAARNALSASRSRIQAMSRLQRRLHSPDLQMIDAGDYLRELMQDAADMAGQGKAALSFAADPLPVPHEVALPLGLIASELAMNAVEHGTRPGAQPRLVATLRRFARAEDGRIPAILELGDDGPGLPPGFDVAASDSLGITISRQFAEMLDGTLELTNAATGGAVARLHFFVPAEQPAPAADDDPPASLDPVDTPSVLAKARAATARS